MTILPIDQNKRTAIVDILRGWALLGVIIGNYSDFFEIGLPITTKDTSMVSLICQNINTYFFALCSHSTFNDVCLYVIGVCCPKI